MSVPTSQGHTGRDLNLPKKTFHRNDKDFDATLELDQDDEMEEDDDEEGQETKAICCVGYMTSEVAPRVKEKGARVHVLLSSGFGGCRSVAQSLDSIAKPTRPLRWLPSWLQRSRFSCHLPQHAEG